ncbi:MAG: histidine--tRNA ligase [Thermoplasmatota archaeon]
MIERPRGTRDLSPVEMEIRRKIETELRKVCENFGYGEVLTPTFEHTQLFLERSGPSIVEEIYSFKDKGGREIALRPEFTAPVMRMYANSMREEPKPLKLFYFGPAFRYERPQSGRYREFWHFGSELVGPDTPRADAENIALAFNCLKKIGLEDFNLRISNLKILDTYLKERSISKESRGSIYHRIDKENLSDVLDKFNLDDELLEFLSSSLEDMKDYLKDIEPVEYLEEVMNALDYYGIEKDDYKIDIKTVRGLDYYKGVVFEIEAESLGAEKQICGGGDYNLGDIFGIDISSKGFAIGFDRTILALKEEGKLPYIDRPTCYVIPIEDDDILYSYEVLRRLRDADIVSDIELMGRSVGKALAYADKKDFVYSLLIGEKEVEEQSVTIKDMDSGEQYTIYKEDLIGEIKIDE